MKHPFLSIEALATSAGFFLLFGISTPAPGTGPQIVSGLGAYADCRKPWNETTKYSQSPRKEVRGTSGNSVDEAKG
jgi:hypothetical protein